MIVNTDRVVVQFYFDVTGQAAVWLSLAGLSTIVLDGNILAGEPWSCHATSPFLKRVKLQKSGLQLTGKHYLSRTSPGT